MEQLAHGHSRPGALGKLCRSDTSGIRRQLDLTPAIRFLVDLQTQEGCWHDFDTLAGRAVDWPTGYVADALLDTGDDLDARRAVEPLLAHQQLSGGWGYHPGVPDDCDSTAYVLMFLIRAGVAGEAVDQAVGRLLAQQRPDGGFATYGTGAAICLFMGLPEAASIDGWTAVHPEVTAAAARALLFAGEKEAAERAWHRLVSLQAPDGRWPSYWWTSDLVAAAQTSLLARELGTTGENSLARAIAWCERTQAPDGAWHDGLDGRPSAFATALALLVLGRDGHARARERGVDWLLARQRRDGGWDGEPSLRLPPPWLLKPSEWSTWQIDGRGAGAIVRDASGAYTTATVLRALCAS